MRADSSSRDSPRIDDFEERMRESSLSVPTQQLGSGVALTEAGMFRRLRYYQEIRRARLALLDGNVQDARNAAHEAFRQQGTMRAAMVIAALWISPRTIRSHHPAKNRVQKALSRKRFRTVSSALR
jgi:hypothetical protein